MCDFVCIPQILKTTGFGAIFIVSEEKEEAILFAQNINTLVQKVENKTLNKP